MQDARTATVGQCQRGTRRLDVARQATNYRPPRRGKAPRRFRNGLSQCRRLAVDVCHRRAHWRCLGEGSDALAGTRAQRLQLLAPGENVAAACGSRQVVAKQAAERANKMRRVISC
jgi:hypothetical protein